jgi:hypothetical protein
MPSDQMPPSQSTFKSSTLPPRRMIAFSKEMISIDPESLRMV